MENELTKVQDYINQGSSLYSIEKYEDAKEFFNKAIAEDSMNVEAYIDLAQAEVMLDNYDAARDALKKVLLIDKKNGYAYFHLGNIEMLEGRPDAAKEYYAKAISVSYTDVQIHLNLAFEAEEREDYATALSYYDKVIAQDRSYICAKINIP